MRRNSVEIPEANLSFEQLLQFLKTESRSFDDQIDVFAALKTGLTFDQGMQIMRELKWNIYTIELVLNALQDNLTIDQVMQVLRESKYYDLIAYRTLSKFYEAEGTLTFDQVIKILRRLRWKSDLSTLCLDLLRKELSLNQVIRIARESQWNHDMILSAFDNYRKRLSFAQAMHLLEGPIWEDEFLTSTIFLRLEKNLSFDQIMEIIRMSEYDVVVMIRVLKKQKTKITSDQIEIISTKSGRSKSEIMRMYQTREDLASFLIHKEFPEK